MFSDRFDLLPHHCRSEEKKQEKTETEKKSKKTKTKKQRKKKKISNDAIRTGLSHFVAPLYVAPSTTPGNAKTTSEFT